MKDYTEDPNNVLFLSISLPPNDSGGYRFDKVQLCGNRPDVYKGPSA